MAEKVSSESGRLGISRTSDAVRKRRERRWAIGKLRGDIRAIPRSLRNESNDDELCLGFDLDYSSDPYYLVKSVWGNAYDIALYGRLGVNCHNLQNGTNFKFVRWEKYNITMTSYVNIYVTLEAMDPATNSVFSFQTKLMDVACANGISIWWRTLACRIKCNEPLSDIWGDTAIDDFYKGEMPKWLSDDDLAADNKKYYVVQESELHENDWLHLFSEIAFFSKAKPQLEAPPPLEIKKVVVEIREEATREPYEKLKAENAIFYISYKYKGDPSTGWAGDHKGILRKTMDGKAGHMCIEVAGGTEDEEEEE